MSLEALWYLLLAVGLATYVVLDGFDLGAGILHLWVARSDGERDQVLRSVGPVWDGNEVWLLAGGGTLFFAFPKLYAVSFSGFYLPLMMVLWFLLFRALGIELRHQIHDSLWTQVWDVAFFLASLLLAIFFGAALGNVIRGVPLDATGQFFEPLWTDFRVGAQTGILDWYTISVALLAAIALLHHGALWLLDRTDGAVQHRAGRAAGAVWLLLGLGTVAISLLTFSVQPWVRESLQERPWGLLFPLLALGGWLASWWYRKQESFRKAFLASCLYLYSMMATAAVGLYPYVLPARDPQYSLTAFNAATSEKGLTVGLFWWIPGMLLVVCYFVYLYRKMPRRFTLDSK